MTAAAKRVGGVGIRGVGQIAIVATDTARAMRFYRDTLGLKLLFEAPPGLAFFDCGGVRLMITGAEGAVGSTASIIYYEVGDIHAARDALDARGVRFEQEPHIVARLGENDLWMAFFKDSEGNLLAILCEKGRG
ncbi:MAG: glyoxalase/bleomycin resistance/dioxygenase family protein [Gemmatimonadaceae bacterium]